MPEKNYSIGGGSEVPVFSSTQAYTSEYQNVTSHGNEAVSDTTFETDIERKVGMVVLTSRNLGDSQPKRGVIHVPIHNPPTMTKNGYLHNMIVQFDSTDDAVVDSLTLCYDGKAVGTFDCKKSSTFHVDVLGADQKNYKYPVPSGICVSLDLRFPCSNSSISLYSVALLYNYNNTS